jgi:hypothetical protein
MYNNASSPTVTGCTFIGNIGASGGGIYGNGANQNSYSSVVVTNSMFVGNSASNGGATCNGCYYYWTMTNCTCYANTASSAGGMWYNHCSGSSLTVTNSILWNDSAPSGNGPEIYCYGGSATVTYSCVHGGYTGAGNIATDPQFVNISAGNYQLQNGSPCIDKGTLAGAPSMDNGDVPRPQGSAVDMGAYEFPQSVIIAPIRSGQIVVGDSLRFAAQAFSSEQYHWSLGDGRTSTAEVPGLVGFLSAGIRNITLDTINVQWTSHSKPSTITVLGDPGGLPDFSAIALSVPNGLAVGQPSQVKYTVRNIGKGAVSGTIWNDAVYLSRDAYLDATDTLLTSVSVMQDLAPGTPLQSRL